MELYYGQSLIFYNSLYVASALFSDGGLQSATSLPETFA